MMDEFDRQLGLRVRRRRRLLGLTQRELASICGVRFQQIQKYEAAANKMSAGMIGRLAQALGVEVGYFYAGLEAKLAPPPANTARPAERGPSP
ncbi:MAG: helix-turn-helix transcriptional regulator [Phenylobacterium sp.]|nr:helix-turn-helix transcriptional regulator [Phenylobacterium sp.]